MAYIGNQPALQYITFAKQTFTADSATVAFTLDNSVANENELEVFVNNVRQEPGSGKAYTASGTTLTMSEAPNTGDDFYCIYQGRATQTVTPGDGTVTNAMMAETLTIAKGGTGATTFAAAGMTMTPAFSAHRNSNFSAANETTVIIVYDDEEWDTDSAYDTSNGRFTVPSGKAGKYMFYASTRNATSTDTTRFVITLRKNGTSFAQTNNNNGDEESTIVTAVADLAVGDYVDSAIYQNTGATKTIFGDSSDKTKFFGFRLIGV